MNTHKYILCGLSRAQCMNVVCKAILRLYCDSPAVFDMISQFMTARVIVRVT